MKVQNLAIIFIIIILPILLILGYYLKLQEDTLELQSSYDAKLSSSTKEGIRAYEINTVNWRDRIGERRRNVAASMNTFLSSLANNIGISGTAREYMANYVPAVAMTMYDGYYIYAPAYVSETIETKQGVQLYYDGKVLTTEASTDGILNDVAYKPSDKAINTITLWYTYVDEKANEIKTEYTFTTDAAQAKKVYKHSLSNEIAYSGTYKSGSIELTINYSLDNRIYVYGKDGTKNINEQGYLVAFSKEDGGNLPRISLPADPKKDSDITVMRTVKGATCMGSNINSEILREQVLYIEEETNEPQLETYMYIHDIKGEKLYYDEEREEFFSISATGKKKNYLENSKEIKVGDERCRYKSVSILTSDTTYKKLYQVLNGRDKGRWYIGLKEDPKKISEVGPDKEIIDTEIKVEKRKQFEFTAIYRDYSAVSYYVEAYAFTNWLGEKLKGEVTQIRVKFNEEERKYESERITIPTDTRDGKSKGIFEIDEYNDMEKEGSRIAEHKRETMINTINSNLNLSISNYSSNSLNEYRLPILTSSDWDQVFQNISMIAFFQGVPIGLKTYNNYAIATSTQNRDYVDPDELFFSSNSETYHRPYCTKLTLEDIEEEYRGYRSVEYVLKDYKTEDKNIYYYQHTKQSEYDTSKNSDLACYSCIVNKENYERIDEQGTLAGKLKDIRDIQAKAYKEALARERYYQNEDVVGNVRIMIRYHENIDQELYDKGIITNVSDIPDDQEAEPGVPTTLSDQTPIATTNNPYIEYRCIGWSKNPNSTVAAYSTNGDTDTFEESVDLYAIWTVSLAKLNWKKDWKWTWTGHGSDPDRDHGYFVPGGRNVVMVNDGSISHGIFSDTDGGSVIEMEGNGEKPGKGACWTEFESDFLKISEFSFEFNVGKGDSFAAAGFLFNVTETDDTLQGYLFSINLYNPSQFYEKTSANPSERKYGAIYKFKYTKNQNSELFDDLELVQGFDINISGAGRDAGFMGKVNIKVTDYGYLFTSDFSKDVPIAVNQSDLTSSFGFFSEHYGHGCSDIGYFKLYNIKVSVVRK